MSKGFNCRIDVLGNRRVKKSKGWLTAENAAFTDPGACRSNRSQIERPQPELFHQTTIQLETYLVCSFLFERVIGS